MHKNFVGGFDCPVCLPSWLRARVARCILQKKTAILSKVPDIRSVVILERHRESREEQGKVGHSRTRAVVLNLFFVSYPFCQTRLPD